MGQGLKKEVDGMAKKAKNKAVKKKAAKKKTAKKAVSKTSKKKAAVKPKAEAYVKVSTNLLGESPKEYEFYVKDGKKLKSVFELVDALEDMTDNIFSEHVTEMKNDFSTWLNDVFDEKHIAKEIEKTKDRIETQKKLMKALIQAAKKSAEEEK